MPVRHCIAVNCNSDSRKYAFLRYHQLPKVDNVRKKWLCLVRREGLDIDPATDNRHHVVCEKHFVDGFPTPESPFPTLFAYNNFKQRTPWKSKNSIKGRHTDETECTHEPEVKKVKLVKCNKEQKSTLCYPYVSGEIELTTFNTNDVSRIKENSAYECSRGQTEDHSYHCTSSEEKYCHQEKLLAQIVCLEAKCGQLETENRKLEEENKRLKTENEDLKSSTTTLRELFLHNVLQNDKNVKHFLGIGSLALFASLLHLISKFYDEISFWKGAGRSGTKQWQARQQRKPGVKRKLTVKEEFVLVMMKFRLGLDNITLSTLFGVSVGYISNLFSTWMNLLAQLLGPLIKWPTKDKIRKHLPLAFKLKYPIPHQL